MFNFITKHFKKKESKFTGFEVRLWEDGVLIAQTVSRPDEINVYNFPCGSFLKTERGNLTGYNIVPHLTSHERIYLL